MAPPVVKSFTKDPAWKALRQSVQAARTLSGKLTAAGAGNVYGRGPWDAAPDLATRMRRAMTRIVLEDAVYDRLRDATARDVVCVLMAGLTGLRDWSPMMSQAQADLSIQNPRICGTSMTTKDALAQFATIDPNAAFMLAAWIASAQAGAKADWTDRRLDSAKRNLAKGVKQAIAAPLELLTPAVQTPIVRTLLWVGAGLIAWRILDRVPSRR